MKALNMYEMRQNALLLYGQRWATGRRRKDGTTKWLGRRSFCDLLIYVNVRNGWTPGRRVVMNESWLHNRRLS